LYCDLKGHILVISEVLHLNYVIILWEMLPLTSHQTKILEGMSPESLAGLTPVVEVERVR